jgi:hypothetical protein
MNSNAILALVGELYAQVAALTEENKALRDALQSKDAAPSEG